MTQQKFDRDKQLLTILGSMSSFFTNLYFLKHEKDEKKRKFNKIIVALSGSTLILSFMIQVLKYFIDEK